MKAFNNYNLTLKMYANVIINKDSKFITIKRLNIII